MRNINVRNRESNCKILDKENMMVIWFYELKEGNSKYRLCPTLILFTNLYTLKYTHYTDTVITSLILV